MWTNLRQSPGTVRVAAVCLTFICFTVLGLNNSGRGVSFGGTSTSSSLGSPDPMARVTKPFAARTDQSLPGLSKAITRSPIRFESNRGQANSGIDFLSRGARYTLYLSSQALSLVPIAKPGETVAAHTISEKLTLQMVGGERTVRPTGIDPLPGTANYLVGNDPKRWLTNIPTYARVVYRNLYPGITMILYGREDQIEYDFVISPGANPRSVRGARQFFALWRWTILK